MSMGEFLDVVKVLPDVARDLTQPAAKNLGKALGNVAGLVNTATAPLAFVNAYSDALLQENLKKIAKRLEEIPDDEVCPVPPEIGIPALKNLGHTQDPDLVKLYIELLLAAATESRSGTAHPSFVNIIGNLCPDEAVILEVFRDMSLLRSGRLMVVFNGPIPRRNLSSFSFVNAYVVFGMVQNHANSPYVPSASNHGRFEINVPNGLDAYINNLMGLRLIEEIDWPNYSSKFAPHVKTVPWAELFPPLQKQLCHFAGVPNKGHFGLEHFTSPIRITSFGRLFLKATASPHSRIHDPRN